LVALAKEFFWVFLKILWKYSWETHRKYSENTWKNPLWNPLICRSSHLSQLPGLSLENDTSAMWCLGRCTFYLCFPVHFTWLWVS
jgi:hypothetical protein